MGRTLSEAGRAETHNASPARFCAGLSDKPSAGATSPATSSLSQMPCGQGGGTAGADTRTSQAAARRAARRPAAALYLVAIHAGLRQGSCWRLVVRCRPRGRTLTVTAPSIARSGNAPIRRPTSPDEACRSPRSHGGSTGSPDPPEPRRDTRQRRSRLHECAGTALYDSNIRKHWHRVSADLDFLDAWQQPAPLCGDDHARPRCPSRSCPVSSGMPPSASPPTSTATCRGDQQAGRGCHGQGFSMRPNERDSQAMRTDEASGIQQNAFPVKPLCFGGIPKM